MLHDFSCKHLCFAGFSSRKFVRYQQANAPAQVKIIAGQSDEHRFIVMHDHMSSTLIVGDSGVCYYIITMMTKRIGNLCGVILRTIREETLLGSFTFTKAQMETLIFNNYLNESMIDADRMWSGRLFHVIRGAGLKVLARIQLLVSGLGSGVQALRIVGHLKIVPVIHGTLSRIL